MAPDREVNLFVRAALQRMEAAGVLREHHYHLDAIYLGGYAIECALKAVILADVPVKDRPGFIAKDFRGARGHDFEYLKFQLRRSGRSLPAHLATALRDAGTWSAGLRYNVGTRTRQEADRFFTAVEVVIDWAKRSV